MKPTKFTIGDVVGHKQSPSIQFQVVEILDAVDGKQSLYACTELPGNSIEPPTPWMTAEELADVINGAKQTIFKYREEDLFRI